MDTVFQLTIDAEARLRKSILRGDIDALDALLDDELVFTDQDGRLFSKADDLEAHRSKTLRVDRLDHAERWVRVIGDAATVVVRVNIAGAYAGQSFSGEYVYTRVWSFEGGPGKIVVAHCSAVK